MSDLNMTQLIGNLGDDPESRDTNSGTVTTIRVATTAKWKDGETGELRERTEWHRVKFFGRLAEIARDYLKKGRQVYIKGELRYDKYTDGEGIERFSVDIVAEDMQMLGGGKSADDDQGERGAGTGSGQQPSRGSSQQRSGNQAGGRGNGYGSSSSGGNGYGGGGGNGYGQQRSNGNRSNGDNGGSRNGYNRGART